MTWFKVPYIYSKMRRKKRGEKEGERRKGRNGSQPNGGN